MKVRDFILVSHAPNGGLDVPLVFELELQDRVSIAEYVLHWLPDAGVPIRDAAFRLAERGIPQGITALVVGELCRRGRLEELSALEPFPCPQSKVVP